MEDIQNFPVYAANGSEPTIPNVLFQRGSGIVTGQPSESKKEKQEKKFLIEQEWKWNGFNLSKIMSKSKLKNKNKFLFEISYFSLKREIKSYLFLLKAKKF